MQKNFYTDTASRTCSSSSFFLLLLRAFSDKCLDRFDAATRQHLIDHLNASWPQYNRYSVHDAGSVRSLSWSPDGTKIVSGIWEGPVTIWHAETRELLNSLEDKDVEDLRIRAKKVAWSPDGRTIASGFGRPSLGGILRIWDAETGQELRTIRTLSYNVEALAWSPDSRKVATGPLSGPYDIKIWDVVTGELVQTLSGHGWSITSIRWSPDGTKIASGAVDGTCRIWDAKAGVPIRVHSRLEGGVISVDWSPDSRKVAAGIGGINRGIVRIWDAETGKELASLYGHSSSVYAVSWSADGQQLASATLGSELIIWNTETYEPLHTMGRRDLIQDVSWSPDGTQLAWASGTGTLPRDPTIRIWDAESYQEVQVLSGHDDAVTSISWSPDGRRLVSGSFDRTIRVWDVKTGQELIKLVRQYPTLLVRWSPDGTLIACGTAYEPITIYNAETYEQVATLPEARLPFSWSPDSRSLVAGLADQRNVIQIWDVESGQVWQTFRGHENGVTELAWSPDATKIASREINLRRIKIWDVESGQVLWPDFAVAYTFGWSPDSRNLVLGGSERAGVHIWDVETGQRQRSLLGHGLLINTVNWSPRGDRIASGGADLTIRIWGERAE